MSDQKKARCPYCNSLVEVPLDFNIIFLCNEHGGKCQWTGYSLVPIETGEMERESNILSQLYTMLTLGNYVTPYEEGAPGLEYTRHEYLWPDGTVSADKPRDITNLRQVTFVRLKTRD